MPAETLTGICPTCQQPATFAYIGPQYGHDDGVIHLYLCSECESSVSGRRILTEDGMAEYLRQNGWVVSRP